MKGVYELSVNVGLCNAFKVDYEDKYGRGSQARACASAMIKYREGEEVNVQHTTI